MVINIPPMSFFTACVVYLLMGAVLAAGIVLAVTKSPLLLILGFLVFLGLFSKFGCLIH